MRPATVAGGARTPKTEVPLRYWLSINDGKTYGPYDPGQLAALVQKGRMDQSAMLCAEGSTDWQPVTSVLPDLFGSADADFSEPEPEPAPSPRRDPRAGARRAPEPAARGRGGGRSAPPPSDDGGGYGGGGYDGGRYGGGRSRGYEERDPDDESTPIYFLARIVKAIIDWLAGIASGGIFRSISLGAWNFGHIAYLAGAAALLAFAIIFAVRLDKLSLMGLALTVPVAAAIGQYTALRFAPTNELLVKNSPLRASSETLFQLLGFVLMLVATGLVGLGVYFAVKEGEAIEIAAPAIAGGILASVGFLFFSPSSLSLTVDPSASAGEDGLALVGTFIKALLAASRFIFGLFAIAGGIGAAVGTIWYLADAEDFRPYLLTTISGNLLVVAALFPLYAYIMAILYFVLVDAIKGLISLNRGSPAGTSESKAS